MEFDDTTEDIIHYAPLSHPLDNLLLTERHPLTLNYVVVNIDDCLQCNLNMWYRWWLTRNVLPQTQLQ